MDRIRVILNSFVDVPSVMKNILGVGFEIVNGPSHFCKDSRNTWTWSPGYMSSFVAGGIFE